MVLDTVNKAVIRISIFTQRDSHPHATSCFGSLQIKQLTHPSLNSGPKPTGQTSKQAC